MTSLPDPGFADDAGEADPRVAVALAGYAHDGEAGPVLAALSSSRLLVPIVAMHREADSGADIAAVLMQGHDGRKALLAFTSLTALQTWNPEARPVPVSTADAARSAIAEQASALLVDVAGPTMFVVETADLERLAAGQILTPTAIGHAWLGGSSDVTRGAADC